MRTVVIGNRKLARHLLQYMLVEGWDVVGAIVPEGESAVKQANYDPLDQLNPDRAFQIHRTTNINGADTLNWLQSLNPDICYCGGWSQIISEPVLDVPDEGFVGLHSSRLPTGRGGAPVNWSLINGEEEIWISLFYYESEVDAGDIISQGSVPIEPRDDVSTVLDALANLACGLVASTRGRFESGTIEAESQFMTDATYRPRRQPQDGLIDWTLDPCEQSNWIRAQTKPYPGAYTFFRKSQLIIWQANPIKLSNSNGHVGEILAIVPGEGVDVRSGDGVIRLSRIQLGDGPSRWADRFALDIDLSVGDYLGVHHAPDDWCYTGIRGAEHPTIFDTNLTLGDTEEIGVVALSGSCHELSVVVSLDGEVLYREEVKIAPAFRDTIEYTPDTMGTHSLDIRFEENGNTVDRRHLRVFVHGSAGKT